MTRSAPAKRRKCEDLSLLDCVFEHYRQDHGYSTHAAYVETGVCRFPLLRGYACYSCIGAKYVRLAILEDHG